MSPLLSLRPFHVLAHVGVAVAILACTGGSTSEGISGLPSADSAGNQGSSGQQSGCTGVALIAGSSFTTSLSKSGCANGSLFQDMYALTTPANTPLELSATSSAFPVRLSVVDHSGRLIADTSVAAGSTPADLRLLLPADQYRVYVGSTVASTGGIYTLNAASVSEDVADCTRVFVAPGVVTHQQLLPTDCRIGTGVGDRFLLHLAAGQTAKIVWDDLLLAGVTLRVFGSDGTLLSGGLSANPSTTTITSPQSGYYLLEFSYGSSGAASYDFAIQ